MQARTYPQRASIYENNIIIGVNVVSDLRHSDDFNLTKNNFDLGKWQTSLSNAEQLKYLNYGAKFKIISGSATSAYANVIDNSSDMIDLSKSIWAHLNVFTLIQLANTSDSYNISYVWHFEDDATGYYIDYRIRYNTYTGNLEYLFEYDGTNSYSTGWIAIVNNLSNIRPYFSNVRNNVMLDIMWNNDHYSDVGVQLFVCGYKIDTIIDSSFATLGSDLNNARMGFGVAVDNSPIPNDSVFYFTFNQVAILPYLLYGNSYITYSNFVDKINMVSLNNKFDGRSQLQQAVDLSIQIYNSQSSGVQPITIYDIYGYSTDLYFVFDLIGSPNMGDVRTNITSSNKALYLMLHDSIELDPNTYLTDGSVFNIAHNEMGTRFEVDDGEVDLDAPSDMNLAVRNPSLFLVNEWDTSYDRSGDNHKVDPDDLVQIYVPPNEPIEMSNGMLNEYSYLGILVQHDSYGSQGIINGNLGHPVGADRSPSSPFDFLLDGSSGIVGDDKLVSAFRGFRFVNIGKINTSDRERYLGVAWVESSDRDSDAWYLDLATFKILSNDKLSAEYGSKGYNIITLSVLTIPKIKDMPSDLSNKGFAPYPSLAIVPDKYGPDNQSFNLYYIKSESGSTTDYDYQIGVYATSDNGTTWTDVGVLNFLEYPFNIDTGEQLKIPVQFDMIKTLNGKYILVVAMIAEGLSQGDVLEDKVNLIMYTSTDGINFSRPQQIYLPQLEGTSTSASNNFAYPSMTYTRHGKHAGEILLGATQINSSYGYHSGVYSVMEQDLVATGDDKDVGIRLITYDYLFANENQKYIVDGGDVESFGSAAFRDRLDRIHVALHKIKTSDSHADFKYHGGMYYAVLEERRPTAKAEIIVDADNSLSGNYEIVSYNRLMQYNRGMASSLNSDYNTALYLQPSFSVVDYGEAFFTFYADYEFNENNTSTTRGSDIVWKLFRRTDLGELYPPGPGWHYAFGHPWYSTSGSPTINTDEIWRPVNSGVTMPNLISNGLAWQGGTSRRAVYELYLDADYNWLLPVEEFAIKTRFEYQGESGTPMDLTNRNHYAISLRNLVVGKDPSSGDYLFVGDIEIVFNENSISIIEAGAVVDEFSGFDFTSFKDVYIIGKVYSTQQELHIKIYVEDRTYNRNGVKTYRPASSEPTIVSLAGSTVTVTDTEIYFGSQQDATGDWNSDVLLLKYIQFYFPMYKKSGNIILSNIDGERIDGEHTNQYCKVGGATAELATRSYMFKAQELSNYPGVILTRGIYDNIVDHTNDFSRINNNVYSDNDHSNYIDIGNNIGINMSGNNVGLVYGGGANLPIKGKALNGVVNLFDGKPSSMWANANTASPPIYVGFDSQNFVNKKDKLVANSIWLLRTNLVNARIYAGTTSSIPASYDFMDAVSFIVDKLHVEDYQLAGTQCILTDSTKLWKPGQFVNKDRPFYVVNYNSTTGDVYGGRITNNTEATITFERSVKLDNTLYDFNVDTYYIIAPDAFKYFDSDEAYRYWALVIKSNVGNDLPMYGNGVAYVAEMGLGYSIKIDEFNYSVSLRRSLQRGDLADGHGYIYEKDSEVYRLYDFSFQNIPEDIAHKLKDIFDASLYNGKLIWLRIPSANYAMEHIGLFKVVDNSYNFNIVFGDYLNGGNTVLYNVTVKMQEVV